MPEVSGSIPVLVKYVFEWEIFSTSPTLPKRGQCWVLYAGIPQIFVMYNALKSLYCSLVRSALEYTVQMWVSYHEEQISRLENVQRSSLFDVLSALLKLWAAGPPAS